MVDLHNTTMRTIKDISKYITSGGTPPTSEASYYNGDIPWLRTQEVNFNFINETLETITKEGLEASSAKWIPSESVIVAMYGNSAGRVAFNKIPLTTNQACCNIIVDKSIADPLFLFYYLVRNYYKLEKLANGAAQQNLNVEVISNFSFPNISLSEQKRIANILSSFDNKIEILKKENKILEDIAENIFKEWFVKYNFPNKDGKPYRDSNGKMIDSELGPIPDGWRVGKLGEIVDVTSGKALPKDDLKSNGQYPLLGANGEIGRTDKYLLNKTVIYTGRVGTLGNVFLYDAPAWYSDNTLIISPTQSFLYYIFFVLQRQQLEKLDRGSTQPLITQTDLKNILVVIPDNDILTLFNKTIQTGNDRITISKRLLKTLDKIKTALLYKLTK